MNNKQKEQIKKSLVFGGLGLLFTLSLWFIFTPSGNEKSSAEQGLNDSIPQATTEQLMENKLKAYEMGDRVVDEEQTRIEMGRLSDYFDQRCVAVVPENEESVATNKIEHSMERYEENSRLLNSFYTPDPYEEERKAMREELDALKQELYDQRDMEYNEDEKQLALMKNS